MRNSFLVRRSSDLLLAAVILWTVLTIVFYSFVAQPVFTRIKVAEILPRAERLVNEHSPSAAGGVVTPFFAQSVLQAYELFGNWLFALNENGELVISSPLPEKLEAVKPEIMDIVVREHNALMTGNGDLRQTEENLTANAGRFIEIGRAHV